MEWRLLIAPFVELKSVFPDFMSQLLYSFNRTICGIEMIAQLLFGGQFLDF